MERQAPHPLHHYESYAASCPIPDGWLLFRARATASTNADARTFAESGGVSKAVLWSDEQKGGRGRRGRDWVSPPGNLYASLVLRPERPLSDSLTLGFVAGVSLVQTLKTVSPSLDVALKWPNDVLIEGRKLAGILLESAASGTICDYVVIGIGVNLTVAPVFGVSDERGDRAAFAPCALSDWIAPPSSEAFLCALLGAFHRVYDQWQRSGFRIVRDLWEASAVGIGEHVSVQVAGETITGVFQGLDDRGAMLLAERGGDVKADIVRVTVGDVVFHGAGTSGRP